MIERSRSTAQEVSAVAAEMQATSLNLCGEIPEIVRRAVTADLREHPRYEVRLKALIDYNGATTEIEIQDVSEGGARIAAAAKFAVGSNVAVTFPGMKPILGIVMRDGGDNVGISFAPSRLRAEELRDLVTAKAQAA
jgi:hypothetical protein